MNRNTILFAALFFFVAPLPGGVAAAQQIPTAPAERAIRELAPEGLKVAGTWDVTIWPQRGGDPIKEQWILQMDGNKVTGKIKAPLLIHYAGLDTNLNNGWPAFETALKANHVNYAVHIYEGANHGFHNDTTPRYDKEAATLAWTRTLEFFNKNLR